MSKGYQIASKKDSRQLRQFLAQHGQALVPMVELIEQGRLAVEELVGQLGRAALEAVLGRRTRAGRGARSGATGAKAAWSPWAASGCG